ncbi:50S ribosomal protein L20 [Anaerococcus sp. Marseille-Q7828]|uniref:50S ribosomal protein L20 n=1 Tax=Anaerococcus sp. Marseille-Q7828 TaxID=3036300 RepID=UPI0024AD8FBE|nr:50S ribosomal protein L20 [Anaerococcus sp. Marseille-Q7828]
MARVKRGLNAKKRHKKVLRQAKGYYGSKHTLYRTANQAVMKSLNYAYIGRKHRKRDFRKLWIARINAAARANGTSYSQFMGNLKKANIDINRKMLAEIAVENPAEFTKLVELANQNA